MRYRIPFKRSPEWTGEANGHAGTNSPQHSNGHVEPAEDTPRQWWEEVRATLSAIPHPGLWLALAIGMYVRLSFTLEGDFPLNDGGMFYTMALDIQRAGFALPHFTTYNLDSIPFAYPPLGLYIAAVVEALTPLDMLAVTRFLPVLFNILTVGAVYFLALHMLSSKKAAMAAAIAFALVPRSYTWMIVGGGLTRSPALLFSVIGILFMYRFYTSRQWRHLAPATLFGAMAVLTHPEVGWFTAFTYALLFLFHGLHIRGTLGSGFAVVGVVVLTAPWWGTVIARHGLDPMLAASGTGGHDLVPQMLRSIGYLTFTEEPYGRLLAVVGALGAFAALARGHVLLPLWFVLIFVLEPRSAATYATIPLGLMAGLFVTTVLVPGLRHALWTERRLAPATGAGGSGQLRQRALLFAPTLAIAAVLAFLVTYATVGALNANPHILRSLPEGDRTAMEWVTENTPPGSNFLVMVYTHWPNDQVGEWFPAITGQHSVATVQGSEWLEGDLFQWKQRRFYQLIACAYRDYSCVEAWQRTGSVQYDYIYLSQGCCGAELIASLQDSPEHELVYGTREVGIWQYVPPAGEPAEPTDELSSTQGSPWRQPSRP